MTTDEMLDILNVLKAGTKQVEKSLRGKGNWSLFSPGREEFDPAIYDYRVKPEPREVWLQCFRDGTPMAGMALLKPPQPGSDGNWVHFCEVVP